MSFLGHSVELNLVGYITLSWFLKCVYLYCLRFLWSFPKGLTEKVDLPVGSSKKVLEWPCYFEDGSETICLNLVLEIFLPPFTTGIKMWSISGYLFWIMTFDPFIPGIKIRSPYLDCAQIVIRYQYANLLGRKGELSRDGPFNLLGGLWIAFTPGWDLITIRVRPPPDVVWLIWWHCDPNVSHAFSPIQIQITFY